MTTYNPAPEAEPLLTPAEVARMFRVDPKTVTRWAKTGKIASIKTLGGHRRYREAEVQALLAIDGSPSRGAAKPELKAHRPGLVGRTVSIETSDVGPVIVEREDGRRVHVVTDLTGGTEIGELAASVATTLDAVYLGTLS